MPFELDHVFLTTRPGAPELDPILAEGFQEGAPNNHPGQGTACRRIFFGNAYLEFIWLEDSKEAATGAVLRTGLSARCGLSPDVSRLGLCFRPTSPSDKPPVATWDYTPPYLPDGISIYMAESSGDWGEPLIFFLPYVPRRDETVPDHPNGARSVNWVTLRVGSSQPDWSSTLNWLAESGLVRVLVSNIEGVTLGLEGPPGSRVCVSVGPIEIVLADWRSPLQGNGTARPIQEV